MSLAEAPPMLDLYIVLPDEPKPMGRPRVAVIGGHPRVYVDSKVREVQNRLRDAAYARYKGRPATGAIALMVDAFFMPPKSTLKREWGHKRKTSKPDLNNVVANCLDAFTGLLWVDDSQVDMIRATKAWAWDHRPRWEIRVRSRL